MSELSPSDSNPILAELQEMNRWLRVLAVPVLRERLTEELKSKSDRDIYQASTGGSVRDVAKASGVAASTVSKAWNRWSGAGIVAPTDTTGRVQRLIDLDSIGFEIA